MLLQAEPHWSPELYSADMCARLVSICGHLRTYTLALANDDFLVVPKEVLTPPHVLEHQYPGFE